MHTADDDNGLKHPLPPAPASAPDMFESTRRVRRGTATRTRRDPFTRETHPNMAPGAEIRAAVQQGRVRLRQINVNDSSQGQGLLTGC